MLYWLFKSEPETFSLDDLKARGKRGEPWDGTRNYQVRNFMRDQMQPGDLAIFYHSNCPTPGAVGVMEIIGKARPDPSALDPESPYFDPKSKPDQPRWLMVQVAHRETFKRLVPLSEIREDPRLRDLPVAQRGNRLSITPVTKAAFEHLRSLGRT